MRSTQSGTSSWPSRNPNMNEPPPLCPVSVANVFLGFAVFVDVPEWWNWQTRITRNGAPATACGFKSRFGHALTACI